MNGGYVLVTQTLYSAESLGFHGLASLVYAPTNQTRRYGVPGFDPI